MPISAGKQIYHKGGVHAPHRLAVLATSPVATGEAIMPLYPKAFPVMTGKGDRVSGGRGTTVGLLHENFRFVQQPLFAVIFRK